MKPIVSVFTVADYYEDAHPAPAEFYLQKIEMARWCEELGYEGFFAAEHHFHPYGLIPDALQFLTAVAMETERIAIGPAISTLPFKNPVAVAEQMALLDQLSGGRLVPGVGSGYLQHEFEGFNLTPADKRQRFDEALEVIEKALAGKRFKHDGDYWTVPKTRLNIAPHEGRALAPKIAILTELASYHVGKRGYGIMTVPYATVDTIEDAAPLFANYRKGWAESGEEGSGEVFAAVHAWVGDQPAAEAPLNRKHLEKYVYSRLYAKHSDYDECMRREVIASGTPEEVTAQLQKILDTGVTHLKLIVDYGAMPHEEVRRVLEQMQRDVLPNLKAFQPEESAA